MSLLKVIVFSSMWEGWICTFFRGHFIVPLSSGLDNTITCLILLPTIFIAHYHKNINSLVFAAFSTRLFAVLRFESVIHEFDPYFNYRTTRFLAEEGFYKFHNWFDDRAWYPLGRIIGGTIYPGEGNSLFIYF